MPWQGQTRPSQACVAGGTQVFELTGSRWSCRSGGQPGFWGEPGRWQARHAGPVSGATSVLPCCSPAWQPQDQEGAWLPATEGLGGCVAVHLAGNTLHPGEQGSCPGRQGLGPRLDCAPRTPGLCQPGHGGRLWAGAEAPAPGAEGSWPQGLVGDSRALGQGPGPMWARKADSWRLLSGLPVRPRRVEFHVASSVSRLECLLAN